MVTSQIQSTRQKIKRGIEYPGVLGDGSGNAYAGSSKYWVRFPLSTNADGFITYTEARPIRYAGEAAFTGREGTEVLVRLDPYDNVETIKRIVPDYAIREKFDSKILNSSDPLTSWTDVKNFIRLLSRPVGRDTTQITVRENPFHVNDFGDWSTFTGTLPTDQFDVAANIPVTGYHRLAIVFFDFLNNEPIIKYSTTQIMTTAIDSTDYDECFAQLAHNEILPLVSINLANNADALGMLNIVEDLRTWLPTPKIYGFPNPLPVGKSIWIRATHQIYEIDLVLDDLLTVAGTLRVDDVEISATGDLTIETTGDVIVGFDSQATAPVFDAIVRITLADSPYTPIATDNIIFCATDTGAITVALPAGADGRHFKIINTGANVLTVAPNGTEQLYGAGAGVAQTLSKGENIDIHYHSIEGWY